MLVSCLQCQIEFEKKDRHIKSSHNHFCSRSCSAKYNNVGKKRNPPKVRACKKCCSEFVKSAGHASISLCSICLAKYNTRTSYYKSCTLAQYQDALSLKNKHRSWRSAQIRNFARSWNHKLRNLPCQMCGYSAHVEICHIIPISEWPQEAMLGDVNHPTNLLVLCRNHHWEFDNQLLIISDIPKREGD